MEKVLTDEVDEKKVIRWDGVRFTVVKKKIVDGAGWVTTVDVSNPEEMLQLIHFVGDILKAEKLPFESE